MKEYEKAIKVLKTAQENNGIVTLIQSLEEDQDSHLMAASENEQERIMPQRDSSPSMPTYFWLKPA